MNKKLIVLIACAIFAFSLMFTGVCNTVYADFFGGFLPELVLKEEDSVKTEPEVTFEFFTENKNGNDYDMYGFYLETDKLPSKFLVEWSFDNNKMTTEEAEVDFVCLSDPLKVHKLSVKVYTFDENSKKQLFADITQYYKNGKYLKGYDDSQKLSGGEKLETAKKIAGKVFLPVLAIIAIIVYIIYFKNHNSTGGLDFAVERLSFVAGMSGYVEDIVSNEKWSDRKKVKKLKVLRRTITLSLRTVRNMMHTDTLEGNITINNRNVLESIKKALNYLEDDKKKLSISEYKEFFDILFKEHIEPSISLSKQMLDAHIRYLKKTYND